MRITILRILTTDDTEFTATDDTDLKICFLRVTRGKNKHM